MSALTKAATTLRPQAQRRYVEDCKERECRSGSEDAISGWTLIYKHLSFRQYRRKSGIRSTIGWVKSDESIYCAAGQGGFWHPVPHRFGTVIRTGGGKE
jgi:hypothetical protein